MAHNAFFKYFKVIRNDEPFVHLLIEISEVKYSDNLTETVPGCPDCNNLLFCSFSISYPPIVQPVIYIFQEAAVFSSV